MQLKNCAFGVDINAGITSEENPSVFCRECDKCVVGE